LRKAQSEPKRLKPLFLYASRWFFLGLLYHSEARERQFGVFFGIFLIEKKSLGIIGGAVLLSEAFTLMKLFNLP
jgi:hypothetical protein